MKPGESDTSCNKGKLFASLIGQPTTTLANSGMFVLFPFFVTRLNILLSTLIRTGRKPKQP